MIGDYINVTEDSYQRLIGGYVAAIDVLNARIAVKDQYIRDIEAKNKTLQDEVNLAADKILVLKKELEISFQAKT